MSGCRCELCWQAQRAREYQIAVSEAKRWERVGNEARGRAARTAAVVVHGGRLWTAADHAIAMDASLTPAQAADLLGRTVSAVVNKRSQQRGGLGLRRRWSAEEIAALADESLSAAELGRRLGRTKRAVREARKLHLNRAAQSQ